MAFSFFRFLGFGPEGVHFPSFKEGGSLFLGFRGGTLGPVWGILAARGGAFSRSGPAVGPAAGRGGARVANLRRYQEL